MKWEPLVAMAALLFVGMWLVLMPALSRESADIELRIGAERLRANQEFLGQNTPDPIAIGEPGDVTLEAPRATYTFVEPAELAERGALSPAAFDGVIAERKRAWGERPKLERTLLGFFNITNWVNLGWVAIGLTGQMAFFGRMFMQWVVSEKRRESQVPELFWWFSLIGGVCLFTYFVWRVDVVGVLGQSAGVVIYARNLRLIYKGKAREQRRARRERDTSPSGETVITVPGAPPETDPSDARTAPTAHPGGPDTGSNRT